MIQIIDNGSACLDSRQVQLIGNWHQDDIALANGFIDITPEEEHVCEGLPLLDFQFVDATHFSCNIQDNPTAQKPNHESRHEQFVYGTDPLAGQGIPNLFIKVGTAQRVVYLTDNNGNPITGPWNVDPVSGAIVAPYYTQSGFFEGPIVEIPVDPVTGAYSLNNTYPISFDGVGTVAGDRFEVTVRNWNVCNPWNGSQTNPNAGDANTDDAIILIVDGPLANAGPDESICAGDPFNTNGILVDGTSALWTTTGNGSFTNATSPGNAIYTAGSADLAKGWVDLVLHAYATGMCPEHTDTMRLTFDPLPDVPVISISAGANDFCDNNSISITLTSTTSPNGSYLWRRNGVSTGITTRTITLNDYTQAGDYTVTVYGTTALECPRTSLPFTVTIGQPAIVNAGPDQTICSNTPASLAGTIDGSATSATWSTSGTGSFGNAGNLTTTYTPSAADISSGSVTLTLTTNNPTGPCPAVSDELVLTIVRAPQVYAGADAAICQGTAYTVNDATASNYATLTWTENGTGAITAGQGTLTPTYTPGPGEANATVTLTLRAEGNSPCATVTDTKTLWIDRMPVATVGPIQEICNNTSASLAGNSPASGTFGEWTFINNLVWQETFSESPQYATSGVQWSTSGITPDADTYFRVENNRMVGRDLDAEAVWRSSSIPIASVSPVKVSVNLQETGSLENNDYIRVYYSIDGGPETFFTTNGNLNDDFGNLNASVTNLSGNNLRIIIRCRNDNPNEYYFFDDIVVRQVTAQTEPTITTITSPTSTVSGLWQGDNLFRWSVFSTHGGCDSASAIYTIRRDVSPAAANAGPPQTFCETSSTVMAANAATNGGTGTWMLISGSGTVAEPNNPTSAVTGLGYGVNTFRWTISSALGICANTTSDVTITRNRNPIDLSSNVTIVKNPVCYNTPGQLRITGTEADVKYYLRTGGADGSFVQGNGGTITLTTSNLTAATTFQIHAIKDGTGCDIIFGSYTINVNPEFTLAQLIETHNICAGATTTISVALTGGTGPYTIVWNDGSDHTINNYVSGTSITVGPYPAGSTTITLTSVTDNNLCMPASLGNPITITVGSTPVSATLTGSGDACVGSTSSLTVTVTDGVSPYDIVINGVTYPDLASGGSIDLGQLPVGTYTYNLTSVIDACGNPVPAGGLPPAYSFSINEIPSASGTTNDAPEICSNGTTDIALRSTVANSTYEWTVSSAPATTWTTGKAPAGGTGGMGTVIEQNLEHESYLPITVTYTITPKGPAPTYCVGPPVTRQVIVNPVARISDKTASICSGGTFTVTPANGGSDIVPSGTTYTWSTPAISPAGSITGGSAQSTGQTSISQALINTTNASATATYTVTPQSGSCTGPTFTVTVTVNPVPSISNKTASICSGGTFTVTPANGGSEIVPSGTTYTWSTPAISPAGSITGGSAQSTGQTSISQALINTTNASATATYTVTPQSGTCTGPTFTVTVTVNPVPSISNKTASICSGGTFTVTPANGGSEIVPSGTTYTWSTPAISPAGSITGGSAQSTGQTSISQALTNTTSASAMATYTVTPQSGTCTGQTFTVTVTVNPTPVLSSTLTPSDVCSNIAFTYTPTSLTAGTTFSWERQDAPGITTTAPTTGTDGISQVLRNLTSAIIQVTYRYTLTANGCSNAQDVVVNIKPEPVISDQSAGVCSGESLSHHILLDNFTNPGDNVTFTWPAPVLSGGLTGGTARTVPSSADMTDTFVNTSGLAETATYTVTPVYQGCTGVAKTIVVTVGSQPVLADLDKFACSAVPTELVLAVASTSSPADSYDIASITAQAGLVADAGNAIAADSIADVNYLANDRFTNETGQNRTVIYRVRPVFGATCIGDWVDVVVTIRPQPVIVPNQRQTVCSNVASSLEIRLLPANTPAGSTFSWPLPIMSDGTTQGTAGTNVAADPAGTPHITDTFENYGTDPITATYTVTPYSSFGCAGTPVDVVITINPEPVAPVITGDTILCTNQTSVIYSVPATAGSSYAWTVPASVGNIVIDANSAIIITAAATAGSGTITVIETNSFGCAGPAGSFDVDVMAPSPQSDIIGSDIVCALETVVYSVPDHPGSVYTWSLPAGAALTGDPSAASITVTFGTVSGNISVREVNAAGCVTNHNPLAVTVRALPTAIISNSGTVCVEDTHPVNIALTGAAPWRVVYAINGVDQPEISGITASPYTLHAAAAGNYTITSVTDNNDCTNTGIGNATVSYWPVPSATLSGTTAVCAGQSATLTISLTGAAPYTFVYTDGTTPVTVTGHPTNTYTFTVTPSAAVTYTLVSMEDNHGCEGTLSGSATVTIHAQPVLAFAVTDLQCNGDNSGAIDLTVTGSATNSFSWLGPDGFTAGTEDITGIKAGLYNVIVTSSDGCVASGQATVYQPDVLTLSSTGNMVLLCNGDPTGAGSFTAAGGTAPYTFNTLVNTAGATLTPSATSVAVTDAGGGTITVQVIDAHGCTAEATIIVTEPPALNLTATTTNISCFGGNNGTIITSVTGGTAPYIYAWTVSAGGSGIVAGAPNQGALTAGTYEVTVTDANGCQLLRSWTLTQPEALSVTATTDDDLIGTCSSAQLNATVTGGVEPAGGYLYSWSPAAGLTSTTIANPVASPASTTTYTVTVTDDHGCIKTASVTVNVAPVLTAVAFADDNLIGDCPGSETQLHVTVNGGEAPYSFSWLPVTDLSDPAVREPMASPAANTTYTVTVTDANGCTATASVTVNVAPPLDVTAAVDDDLIGTCDGSVAHLTATATGGEGGYAYLWSPATGLSAVDVANPTAKPASTTVYTVTVTDANGCTDQATITVNVAPELAVTASADDLFIGTCETSVSHLDATVTGGEGDYTYKWTPLTGLDDNNIKTPTAKPAVTTTYTVTVTDANGCTATSDITITVRPALTLTLAVDDSSIGTCSESVAHITSTVGGGEPGYTYLWTPAEGLSSDIDPNPTAKPDATTTYTLTVTDQNGCTISRDITINVVSPLTVTASAADPLIGTCPTSNTTLNAVALGGEPGYTYSWQPVEGLDNPSIQTPVADPAVTTTYTVTVTDNNQCTDTAMVTVNVAPDLTAVASADDTNIGTCPTSVAHLDVTATGGEPGYTYLWAPVAGLSDPNSKTPTAKPSATTIYTVTVTDANGCKTTASIEIVVAPVLNVTVAADDYNIGTCNTSVAALTATASGGEPGYTYLWSPPTELSAVDIANPVAKPTVTTTYTVLVTDNNGCTATSSLTITVAPELTATATVSDPNIGTCQDSRTTLDVIVNGGEPGYTYSWQPVDDLNDPAIKNPTAKPAATTTYTVTITDNNSCETTASVTVTVLPELVAVAAADDLIIGTCSTSRSNLSVTVTGGEPGYTYSWSPVTGLNNPNLSNPIAKPAVTTTYTVTVRDANGCEATDDITITVADELGVTAMADDYILSTCSTSRAQITATATGGEELAGGGYTWSWAPTAGLSATNIPNPVAKPESTTTYTVTVTDANGCTAVNTITIEVRPPLAAVATATDYLIGDCDGSTTTLDVSVTGGELPYIYSWDPVASLTGATTKNPVAKPAVNTTYTVTVTDANGCTVTASVTINVAPPLTATAAVDDDPIGACQTSVAHLSTTVSGGEGGYTYLWDNEGTLDDATKANPVAKPAVSTLYTVTVTDANGCTTTAQVQVNVAPDLTVTATADDEIIGTCPTSVANLTATGAGGELLTSGDYTYNWTPAAGLNYTNVKSPVAKPAATTTYTVTITDRNGCTASDQITITVMPPIALTTTPVVYNGGYNITCNGESDGAIDLDVTGGEAPYTIAWSGPAGYTADTEDISGLVAGTYTVIVTDANNCTSTTSVVLLEPAVLTLGKTPDVLLACYGDATATGSFSVSGGTSPYLLSVVTNSAGATVNITATSASFTGGAAGEVTVQVVDDNGCTAQATILITQPPELTPGSIDGDQEVCYLGNPVPLNEVTAPDGGPATILFQWEYSLDGGSSWSSVPGATLASYDPPAGILQTTHFRRRVNSAACDPAYSNNVVVTVNPLPVASIAGSGFVCPGDDATVTVTITTGATPFTVVLSDGTTVNNYTSGDPITVNPTVTTTYTITSVTDNNGCTVAAPHADLTGSATIEIKTVPEIAVQPVSLTVCEDDVATFVTDAGGTTNPQYRWFTDTGSGMTIMPGETAATLSVTAASAMNGYRYQVEISGDCPVPVLSDIVTLTVNEKPEIVVQPADVTLCSGEDATFTVDAGVTTNPVYQWYVNTGSGWTPATGARYQGANTATLTVVSTLEMMSGYQYRVRVSGTCTPYVESDPVTLTVTRQAEIVQHPVSLILCEDETATFTVDAGLTTNPSYQWERSLDGGTTWAPIPGETTSAYTIAAVASADNNTAYRAIVSSSCGSSVTSLPAFLTVNELPEIVDQPDDVIICEYLIADFIVDAGVTTGATYRWQRSTDGGSTWNNLTETSTYFGVSTMNLKVNGTNRVMSGDMFRVIVSGTCTPPDTSSAALLTVNTAPEILAQPVASAICENTSTSFTVSAQGTGLDYQWYVDTGSGFSAITDGGVYTGATSNTLTLTSVPRTYDNYRYRVEIEGTCAPKAISQTVQLDVSIETIINTQPADSAICEFMTASFTALADGANLTYQWQVYDGSVWNDLDNTGLYIGANTPTLMVFGPSRTMDGTRYRVVIGSDCSADLISDEAVLTVYTAPELSDHPDEFRGCPGGSATFSVVAAGTAVTYQWQVNSGSGFVNVTDNGTYSGTTTPDFTISNLDLSMNGYLIRVVVSGTCQPPVTSSFAPLRVYMEPSIISEPVDVEVCDQAGAIFFSQVFNTGAGETTVWQVNQGSGWNNLSDGALYQGTQTPQLVIMSTTTAMNGWLYRLEITGPCGLYYTREALLTVNEWPAAQIEPVDTLLVCGGVPTQLHGNPSGGSGTYTSHRWFGDVGPLSQYNIENPVFNTSMAGYYRLVYQVTDSKGCVGLDTLVIEVEKPVAMFTVDNPSGCQPLIVNFTNGSTGYTSLLWDFGDGDTSAEENPSHIYTNAGPALDYRTVRLEVTSANGCVSSMEQNITVYPEILSDFVVSDDTICSGESIMFSLLPGAFRYYWDFGDGFQETGSNVISHTYYINETTPVTYNVTLRTESFFGCISETTLPVVVYPTPVPAFTAVPASQVFPDATVTFTNNTNAGNWTWQWDFDDGHTSADMSPVHTYAAPGDFNVSLTVSNGICTEDVVHTVRVLPAPPIADFDSIPSGCQPWRISVNNTSLYATTYYWDFGDGHTSNAINPEYTYMQPGTYQVTLTVTGPGGHDSKSQIVHVYPSPRAYFDVSPTKVYVNDEQIRLFNLTEGGDTFIWEFGDGDTSHLREPFHRYTTEGIYDITLHAYSANGCYDTYVMAPAVTVEPFGDLIFATVFKPSQEGPIEIDELPHSGDAMDQFFFPPIRETVLEYHLQIFNRWGTLIFETYDINKPWNGYYKGKLCQQGVYVWLVEGKYANGRPFKKAGDITLLH
jgi:PKD repeat protein